MALKRGRMRTTGGRTETEQWSRGKAGEAAVPKSLNSGLTELSNTAKNPQ